MVLSGKQAPLGKHPVHPEHDLFANPMARGYMCDVCGGSDSRRFTCTQGCDTDGKWTPDVYGMRTGATFLVLIGAPGCRSVWRMLGCKRRRDT